MQKNLIKMVTFIFKCYYSLIPMLLSDVGSKKVEKVTRGNRLKSLIYKDYFNFSTFLLLFFRKKIVIILKDILSPIGVK